MQKIPFRSPYAKKTMRIVFLGTPDFAVPSLQMLMDEGYHVVGVFTQPDRPVGRSKKLQASPIKQCAQENGIDVFQVEKIRQAEGSRILQELQPDLMITAAFGQILSKENLQAPTIGCINVHGSLLPKYRGAAPIQWAVINGETETGITTMLTDEGLDTGDMLEKRVVHIGENETAGELFDRMAGEGASLLKSTLQKLMDGQLEREKQDEAKATHCKSLRKEEGKIDWARSARQIFNQVRGMNPWPCAFSEIDGSTMKIWTCEVMDMEDRDYEMGEIVYADAKHGLIVKTGDGFLSLKEIQMAGSKRMDANAYLNGRSWPVGACFQ